MIFTVEQGYEWINEDIVKIDTWTVKLPHSCDSWCVAGGDYSDGDPHAVAVAKLERFISDAQQALAALKEKREVEGDE